MNKIFSKVAGNHPALNRFNGSYTNTLTAKIGLLYPVQCDEVYPSDVFKMSAYCHCEVQPMVAPLMSDLEIYAHAFFVPMRLLYGVNTENGHNIWEDFITGGKDGDYDVPLTPWTPDFDVTSFASYKIWDYIGNPVSYTLGADSKYHWKPIVPYGVDVSSAPKLAYNKIWNDFYRDENLQDEMDDLFDNEDILKVSFKKDYFTSALEQQQRGISPAIPVYGELNVSGKADVNLPVEISSSASGNAPLKILNQVTGAYPNVITTSGFLGPHMSKLNATPTEAELYSNFIFDQESNYAGLNRNSSGTVSAQGQGSGYIARLGSLGVEFDGITISGSGTASGEADVTGSTSGLLSSVNINQLRLMFAQQRLLELNETGGYRYTEFIFSHFNASPTDARLDRPEYIGGCIIPINVSPSIQASNQGSGTTPQGNKVGIGSADSIQKIGNYRVLEHGVIMTLISIRPKPIYQQGVNRQWLRQSRWDYYFPEFAYLSEQAIYNAELYCDGDENAERKDNDIFGYQAHWNEMRCKNNMVVGAVREQFDYWVTARKFANRPALNSDFIEIEDSDFNKVFAVQNEDEFIISWSNVMDMYRPLPAMGIPGLVDHVYGGK